MTAKRTEPSREACRAAAQLGRAVNRAIWDSDLSPAGYRLLSFLAHGEAPAKTIAQHLLVTRPTVTAALDWLEPRGLIERKPDPSDGRQLLVTMTRIGQAALARADSRVGQELGEVLGHLSDTEHAAVLDSLGLLYQALGKHREARIQASRDA